MYCNIIAPAHRAQENIMKINFLGLLLYYCFQVLRRDLVRAIRRKRPDVEIESLVFHQDNAPAHRAQETIMTIDF